MISFEWHLEKWHEKTQKPLWFLGFPNRYLFRFAMLVAGAGFEPYDLRVILRGCRFAPLRSPFIGLGAFAPLPSATPYPEGKKKGTCINRYLIGCVRSPAIFHKSRGAAPFFSNLRVILRGCRFAPLKSPFIGLGAVAPLPSATPYPEGKKKGTCKNRYLIGCGGRI